jgi:hypothetical protein
VNATSLAGTTLASNVVTSSLTSVGTITAGTWSGTLGAISGASLTNLNATNLASGTVAAARLGSGLASSTTFLAGDSTWQTISVTPAAGSLTGTTLAANVVSSSLTSFGEVTQLAIGSNANVTTSGATGALRLGYLNSAISSTQDAFVCWANGTQALVTGGGSSANGTLVLASRNVSNAGIVLATGGSAKLSIDSAGATTVYGTLTSKAGLTVTSDASLVANGANGSLQLGWLNAAITSTGDAYVAIGGVGASSALSPGQLQGTLILSARNGNSAGVSIATGSTSRLFINSSGAFGIGGANYGSSGQVLTSNGSAAAPTWGAVTAIATQIPRAATFTGTSADIGKRIVISAAPTVPAGVYTPGDVFSFYNNTSVTITIIQGAGLTMHQDGNTNTGNRSLAPYGTCMIWFDSASVCVISGSVT